MISHELISSRSTKIEKFPLADQTAEAYKKAFSGYPLFEDLSDSEVSDRLSKQFSKPGFQGIWLTDGKGRLVGASWYDTPTLDELEKERGRPLRVFCEEKIAETKLEKIIWQRETLISPEFQGKGIGGI